MAELTLNAIGVKIRDDIAAAAAIKSYCNTNFSKAHTVYYGASGDKSPDPDDYPAITVRPLAKHRADEEGERSYGFQVEFIGSNATVTTVAATASVAKKVTYSGPGVVEGVLDLIWAVIEAISSSLTYQQKDYEIDAIEAFPKFSGRMTLEITCPVLIGGAEPAIS